MSAGLPRNWDLHRARLGEVLDGLDGLLAEEMGEDGTYEVSAIEIDLGELVEWRKAIADAVGASS